jgi:hypothetical protein
LRRLAADCGIDGVMNDMPWQAEQCLVSPVNDQVQIAQFLVDIRTLAKLFSLMKYDKT